MKESILGLFKLILHYCRKTRKYVRYWEYCPKSVYFNSFMQFTEMTLYRGVLRQYVRYWEYGPKSVYFNSFMQFTEMTLYRGVLLDKNKMRKNSVFDAVFGTSYYWPWFYPLWQIITLGDTIGHYTGFLYLILVSVSISIFVAEKKNNQRIVF